MKNIFSSKLKISIKGRKIERFIEKITRSGINIYKMDKVGREEINIIINKDDYDKLLKIKTIYEYSILDGYGFIRLRKNIKINKLFIFLIIFGIIIVYCLSNVIFKVEVVYNDKTIRDFIINELDKRGVKKYTLKKSFNELQKIKQDILDEYKDKLEWLEIETLGTNYIVRLEERKLNDTTKNYDKQNVVAGKDAIIKKIEAYSGQIVKEINSYVKKGDIIISGNITLNDEVKNLVRADGKVYGEVWYKVDVSYPLTYKEEKETGKKQKVFVINFLNKSYNLSLNSFKTKTSDSKTIYQSLLLPFSVTYENQREIKIIDEVYTIDEAIKKAEERGKKEIESKLSDKEKIINSKDLKVDIKDSKIELEIFYAVYEDITEYAKIEELLEE